MKRQRKIVTQGDYLELDECLGKYSTVLLVAGNTLSRLKIGSYFDAIEKRLKIKIVRFGEFNPNPLYESVVKGVELFKKEHCEAIIAVGGGSAIDVAKCIKLYSNMNSSKNYLEQVVVPNDIELIAVPTTAGTGSEATRYAVIYYGGEKQSVSNYSCIPSTVLFDASLLKTLPEYQRKVTMLDALCHAIESFWSINSNTESKMYSYDAIRMIIKNKDVYLANEDIGNVAMMKAANIAGKAINITQTTAGHAMSYKLTSLYGIAHGHAVALCVSKLFRYMVDNTEKCMDSRGGEYLNMIFIKITEAMECDSVQAAVDRFDGIVSGLGLEVPVPRIEDYNILKNSVNPIRLKNNPVKLDMETIDYLYHQILE